MSEHLETFMRSSRALCDRFDGIAFVVVAREVSVDGAGESGMAMSTNIQNGDAILELLHHAVDKTTSIATERGEIA